MPKHDLLHFSTNTSGYHLASIHTHLDAHQLAWLLDHHFETSFWRSDKILQLTPAKPKSEHICFYYRNEDTEDEFWLLANQGSDGFLMSDKPKPDYILVGKGDSCQPQLQAWLEKLKPVNEISLAYFSAENSRNKWKWLLWLEHADEENQPEPE